MGTNISTVVSRDVLPYCLVDRHQHSGGPFLLNTWYHLVLVKSTENWHDMTSDFDFDVYFVKLSALWLHVNRQTSISECLASTVLLVCSPHGHREDVYHSAHPIRFLGWCSRLHPLTYRKSKGWSCRGDARHSILYQCEYLCRHPVQYALLCVWISVVSVLMPLVLISSSTLGRSKIEWFQAW